MKARGVITGHEVEGAPHEIDSVFDRDREMEEGKKQEKKRTRKEETRRGGPRSIPTCGGKREEGQKEKFVG